MFFGYNVVVNKQEREGLTVIQIIFGKKGSGKTKRILDMANASLKDAKGNVFFIDISKSYTINLKPQIRFIDASEYSNSWQQTRPGHWNSSANLKN